VLQRLLEPARYTAIRFTEHLELKGIAASIDDNTDAYDSTLAESTTGLFKNETIHDDSPFRNGPLRAVDDVGWVTAEWIDWYNNRRLHTHLGDVPPDEFETAHHANLETPSHPVLTPA